MMNIKFFLNFPIDKIGFPIFPTVFTLYLAIFKIFSMILHVVDLPLVPVIEIINEFLFSSKKDLNL